MVKNFKRTYGNYKVFFMRKIDRCSHVRHIRTTNDSVGTVSLSRDHIT